MNSQGERDGDVPQSIAPNAYWSYTSATSSLRAVYSDEPGTPTGAKTPRTPGIAEERAALLGASGDDVEPAYGTSGPPRGMLDFVFTPEFDRGADECQSQCSFRPA